MPGSGVMDVRQLVERELPIDLRRSNRDVDVWFIRAVILAEFLDRRNFLD